MCCVAKSDSRFEEGIHLNCQIDLHVCDMLVVRWEFDCEVLEIVPLRHGCGCVGSGIRCERALEIKLI